MAKPTFRQAAEKGFIFPNARAWYDRNNVESLARDAALVTTPNTAVPAEFLAYIDPAVIEIMTAPRRAREIFGEEKKGDWTTSFTKWRSDEGTGSTQPYSDKADGGVSGLNTTWHTREQYVFQTSIEYGDLEVATASMAKINLAAVKQKKAAQIIDVDQNKFYLRGVAGRLIYGILNDPNLPDSIVAGATGTSGSTKWKDKTTTQIYNDILALFGQLSEQSSGLIDKDTPLKLCLSPEMAVLLGAATDFNVSVLDMIRKYFSRIDVVGLPELHSNTAGETVFLIAPEVYGQKTGILAFGEKLRAGRVVPHLSSFTQKYTGSTYGGIVFLPYAFASMTGM